ncbi:MAG: creatininase [Comamonadaceae bacterium CG1_02_60_18]|nr:MAG: creatininase [Comamonadaceae bacterium CG1_02_60_18]PIQ52572.1 MAG: creatininase [Comamonadaceae bacterium CG12_big_fil_rev_8_21_14_0_65_59_15]
MKTASRYWADLSARDFAALQASGAAVRTIAVLPVAATEQHGPHLPLSVDTVLVDGIVAAAVSHLDAALPVLFLPTQAVGLSVEHARFGGTLTLKNETILRLWSDIGESVAAAGVKKLLIFNTHGGNVGVMDLVARDLRARLDMLVYSASWFNLPLYDEHEQDVSALFDASEHRFGIHAGDIETSMMLALDAKHVAMQHAQDFDSTSRQRAERFAILGNGKSAKLGWQMQDINPAGAAGNASAASADKGRAVVAAAGRALARLLAEIDQLPPETLVARPSQD